MTDAAREAVARAVLLRRVMPDMRTVVHGHWLRDHDLELADAAIQAYESALTLSDLRRLAAKHGIALVPEEPTDAMLKAGAEYTKHGADHGFDDLPEAGCYRAMLAAAKGGDDDR